MSYVVSETEEQCAVVEYCALRGITVMHVPNEGKRSVRYGAQLKRAGMKRGFPDLFFPMPCSGYHGLFIEMKSKKGRVTRDQEEWITLLKENGYAAHICYGFDQAVAVIREYFQIR